MIKDKGEVMALIASQFFGMAKDGKMEIHACPDVQSTRPNRWIITAFTGENSYSLMKWDGDVRIFSPGDVSSICIEHGFDEVLFNGIQQRV